MLAVWFGAVTHALWNGFTHRYRWPASALYPNASLAVGPWELPFAMWLQWALARRYPRLPEARGGRWRDFLPVLLPSVVLGAVFLGLRLSRAPSPSSLELWLRWTVWHVLDGVLAGLTLGCVLVRLRDRGQSGESPP